MEILISLINSYLAFCFLLFSATTLLQLGVVLSWNMPLFKVWSEDKLNKKFIVAENCFHSLLHMPGGWGI